MVEDASPLRKVNSGHFSSEWARNRDKGHRRLRREEEEVEEGGTDRERQAADWL